MYGACTHGTAIDTITHRYKHKETGGGRGEDGTPLCHMIISVSHVLQRSHMFPSGGPWMYGNASEGSRTHRLIREILLLDFSL